MKRLIKEATRCWKAVYRFFTKLFGGITKGTGTVIGTGVTVISLGVSFIVFAALIAILTLAYLPQGAFGKAPPPQAQAPDPVEVSEVVPEPVEPEPEAATQGEIPDIEASNQNDEAAEKTS